MNGKKKGRRRLLTGGLVALVAGRWRSVAGQALEPTGEESLAVYGRRSRFVKAGRIGQRSRLGRRPDLLTPLQDTFGIITPSGLHYEVSHGSHPPDLDPSEHHLLLDGLVNRPGSFTVEDLKRLPSQSRMHLLECAGNSTPPLWLGHPRQTVQLTHGLTSCSEWTGVPLPLLLEKVGVQVRAKWLVAEGAEEASHIRSLPLGKGLHEVLVAYGQNGEPLRPENGFPLRLVVPGLGGFYSVKWLRRLSLTSQPHRVGAFNHGATESEGLELGPKSVITFPSGQQRLPGSGFFMVTGLAWSGAGPVARVDVSTDGGQSWRKAELQRPVLSVAHTRFRFPWDWDGREAILQSRCIDRLGQVQPTLGEFAQPLGLTPARLLSRSAVRVGHFNVIHPWRVTREGEVLSALTA